MRILLLLAAAAVSSDPIGGVIDAFRTHDVVALGEGSHGNLASHAFRLGLIRDPRFAEAGADIVVEFGSARYQDMMDRYVFGENVKREELRHAWMDTTQPDAIWDAPIYEEFFRAVREVNAKLPKERRIRVLLGDPPIDWSGVHTREDLDRFASKRDEHAVEVIRRQTRRVLAIYGDAHFSRASSWGIVARLEKGGTKVYAIHAETRARMEQEAGSLAPAASGSGFDAVVYFGPFPEMKFSRVGEELCREPGYLEMRLGRMGLIPPPPGVPVSPMEQLKEHCRSGAKR